ncbi:MAG TPA: ubiquinone/menaquinone biosynthesis methyltransferase [Elusimicrobiales bacterium]|nr:ubiquinone/menaquinone biosynthesis methyltransferase [Elusimicrobiales bacterium]
MPEKTRCSILGFYSGIFRFYDAANSALTLGLDRLWRRAAARAVLAADPDSVLDVCCGTGALTFEIARLARRPVRVRGLDLSEPMLSVARAGKGAPGVEFIVGDAARLPFPDSCFDALSISFATRNLAAGGEDLLPFFSEFRRTLRTGGVLVHLETSQPASGLVRRLFRAYTGAATAMAAALAPGGGAAYRFLGGTIASFHGPEELSRLILKAGFSRVSYRPMTMGAVALHTAVK